MIMMILYKNRRENMLEKNNIKKEAKKRARIELINRRMIIISLKNRRENILDSSNEKKETMEKGKH